ncbi:hypothetical protein SNL152K_6874 [Streptomyces sp. NL15-2K]|nr:hypothetical protein SNL152K_6874 [Streptomyces sp. NL15-2K]
MDRHGSGLLAVLTLRHNASGSSGCPEGRPTTQRQAPRGGSRPRLQALAAAAKEKQPETHDAP